MNWSKRKVIVFESDDWGGLERAIPDMRAQRKLSKNKDIVRAINANDNSRRRYYTIKEGMETTADMDALFTVLANCRGGDGRPAIFTPVCLMASPDYRAIKANGFTRYVDIGIDKPFPPELRHCGDIIAKARAGMKMGVWAPESHNTRMAAHIDPHKWVRLLRERKDRALNAFFNLKMIGRPSDIPVADMGKEFDSMTIKELRDWVAVGTRYFRNAFGYAPRATGLSDARSRCRALDEIMEEIMVENGVKIILNAVHKGMGEYNRKLGLTYIKRNVEFEQLSAPADQIGDAWRNAFLQIQRAWRKNEPAIVSTHRLHYSAMTPDQRMEALRQLACLLETIGKKYPEAVYMSSHELAESYRAGK